MRDRAACTTSAGHHQSGKTAMPAKKACVVDVAKAPAPTTADAAIAR
jgi:hypothetical protein